MLYPNYPVLHTNYPVLYPNYPVLYPNYPILYPYYPKTPKIRNIWPLYGLEMQKINFMEQFSKIDFICTNFGKNVWKCQKVDFWHKCECLVTCWYPHPILTEKSKLTILTFVNIFSNIWSKFSKIVRKSWILPFQGHIKGHITDFLGF